MNRWRPESNLLCLRNAVADRAGEQEQMLTRAFDRAFAGDIRDLVEAIAPSSVRVLSRRAGIAKRNQLLCELADQIAKGKSYRKAAEEIEAELAHPRKCPYVRQINNALTELNLKTPKAEMIRRILKKSGWVTDLG